MTGLAMKECEITEEMVRYTIQKIRTAPLKMYPYPHVYIQDYFIPTFYNCIIDQLPQSTAAYRR